MWFRKFSALMLVSLGAALVYLPFPAQLEGERSQEVVQLEVWDAPFSREDVEADFGDGFVELDYEGLEATPEMLEAVLSLMGESGARCVSSSDWHLFLGERSLVDPVGLVYAFRDGLYEIKSVEIVDDAVDGELACIDVALLGAYDNRDWEPVSWIDAEELDEYPGLKVELERLAAGPIPAEGGREVPPREWRRFHRRELDDLEFRPLFGGFDRLCAGSPGDEEVPWTLATPWLRMTAQAAGVACLLFGLALLVASYRASASRSGIPIASTWLAVFCDTISLAGAVIFVALAVDTLWVGPLGQSSLIGLKPEWPSTQPITGLHFVSVPVVLLVLPLLTLWFSSLSGQRVQIDGQGVTSHGALGSRTINWEDIQTVNVREQKNPFAFTVTDFRSLQKVLDIEGDETCLTLNQPSSAARKRKIINLLLELAPEKTMGLIRNVEVEW
jgi:hypothetical protein